MQIKAATKIGCKFRLQNTYREYAKYAKKNLQRRHQGKKRNTVFVQMKPNLSLVFVIDWRAYDTC